MILEILIVVALTLLNGALAMSELAVVSARPARLKPQADRGSRGAAAALRLQENPGRFLSTVQIGITLVGVLSGAFSGATLGARLSEGLEAWGMAPDLADALGVGGVVIAITYAALIFGELVPKQISLRHAEAVAARVAPAMLLLSRIGAPLVWLLERSGQAVLRLLGQGGDAANQMTEEEVKTVIAEASHAGVLEREETDMIAGVMRLADRSARGVMTPRRDVEVVDLADPPEAVLAQLLGTRRSRLPVRDGAEDAIVGVIHARDFFARVAETGACDLREIVQEAPVVMDASGAIDVLGKLRASRVHMALVFDEYGHFEGVITAADILEAVTGVFAGDDEGEPALVRREDGSFLVSGWMPIDEFAHAIDAELDPDPDYETVAGLALDRLNRLPTTGEIFRVGAWRFEIVDMDGRRVDKLLVTRVAEDA